MAFTSTPTIDTAGIGSGQPSDIFAKVVLSTDNFEDGLKIGRFAKFESGRIDNIDGSASPVPAGVVVRSVANPIEDGDTYSTDNTTSIEYIRQGLVSVDVKAGDTPTRFGRVYISNQGDANDGMATTTDTEPAANAEFISKLNDGTWLVYVTPYPGDIASYVASTSATTPVLITDPGDAGAIPVTSSGNCAITTTDSGGETRTVAAPAAVGITLDISHDVDGGDVEITVASAFDQAGKTKITMADAGDFVRLAATQIAGALSWRLVVNDGATLG